MERKEIKRYVGGLINWNAATAAPLAARRAAGFAEAHHPQSASDWKNIESQIARYLHETKAKMTQAQG